MIYNYVSGRNSATWNLSKVFFEVFLFHTSHLTLFVLCFIIQAAEMKGAMKNHPVKLLFK